MVTAANAEEWQYEDLGVPIAYFDNGAAQLQFACRGGDLALGFWVRAPHRQVAGATAMNLAITPDPAPAPKSYFREELYQRGDTLPAFIERLGIEASHAAKLAKLRVLQQLRPGTQVSAEVSAEGEPLMLSFLSGRDTLVKIAGEGNGFFRVTDDKAQLYTRVAMKSGSIQSSLFAAADEAGIPDSVAMQLGDVFGGDIDFHRDLRKGDQFAVVYELHYLGGRPVRAGRLLAGGSSRETDPGSP